tara:strand:+ start:111 stop:1385 length:1275 start_codon:yes stop_codon:yes gene_type:complete
MSDSILDRIGSTLEKGVGGAEKLGSGIGTLLAQLGGDYLPRDPGGMEMTDQQRRGLLQAQIRDRRYGPAATSGNVNAYMDSFRADKERSRVRGMMNDPDLQARVAAIQDPNLQDLIQSQVASGNVEPALQSMYTSGLESTNKQAMIDAATQMGLTEDELAFLGGMTADQIQLYLQDKRDEREGLDQTSFNESKQLRSEFITATAPFRDREEKFEQIYSGAQNPSAAGDIAMIFAYMKMLDPTSVVRESEYATAAAAGPLIDTKTRGLYNQVVLGQRLTAAQRADFLKVTEGVYRTDLKKYETNLGRYQTLATNSNLDFENDVMPNSTPAIGTEFLDSIDYDAIKNNEGQDDPGELAAVLTRNVRATGNSVLAITRALEQYPNDRQTALRQASETLGYEVTEANFEELNNNFNLMRQTLTSLGDN